MIPNIPNIRHLAAFAATVRHGTVTRAARAVNLTQPALTQAIARLEAELDCRLFERAAAGMTPTEPALLLAPRVEAAIAHIGSPRVTGTQMRAFIALSRSGSYAGAAEGTGLSPASLHRAVGDLSLALGQRLTGRQGRNVTLSQAGRRRARAFGLAMAELRAGFDEVAAWQGKRAGRVAIGAMPLCRAQWLPDALLEFSRRFPDVDTRIVEGSYADLSGPLRDGEIDMILGALREETPEDLEQFHVFEDRPQIMARAGHPLFSRGGLTGEDLAGQQWILPDETTPLRHYWEDMMRAAGVEPPHVAITCGSPMTIRQLMLGSDQLTLLSPAQLAVEVEAGLLSILPPPMPVTRAIGIVTRRDWRATAPQAVMLDLLRSPPGNKNS